MWRWRRVWSATSPRACCWGWHFSCEPAPVSAPAHGGRVLPVQQLALRIGRRRGGFGRVDFAGPGIGALHRGPPSDVVQPALQVREVVDLLLLPQVRQHPRVAGNVGDRIVAGDELAAGELVVEHGVQARGLAHIAVDGIGNLLRRVVDDGGDAVVRCDSQKVGLELIALADVHREDAVRQPGLFKIEGDLVAVGRGPVVQIDHGFGGGFCGPTEYKRARFAAGLGNAAAALVGSVDRSVLPCRQPGPRSLGQVMAPEGLWSGARVAPSFAALCETSDASGARRISCACASVLYSGRLIQREIRLAPRAAAIRLSTMEWPLTISITMMKAVIGACVTAARNPAMPSAINAAELASQPVNSATSLPSPAPMANDGAKIPPGTPDQAASQVAISRRLTYSSGMSVWPSSRR